MLSNLFKRLNLLESESKSCRFSSSLDVVDGLAAGLERDSLVDVGGAHPCRQCSRPSKHERSVACWTFTWSSSPLWITEPDWIPSSCRNATGTMTVEEESSWVKFSFKVIPSWNLLSSHQCLTLLLTIFLKAESWCATNQCFVLNEPVALPSCGNRATFTA